MLRWTNNKENYRRTDHVNMDEAIRRTDRRIKWMYALLWLSAVLGFVAGETCDACVGLYAGNARVTYVGESVTILLTLAGVPTGLWAFARVLRHRVDRSALPVALRGYALWSGVRLLLLALPLWSGIAAYYLLMSRSGALCALVALVASLFCVPSLSRLRRELHLDGNPTEESPSTDEDPLKGEEERVE